MKATRLSEWPAIGEAAAMKWLMLVWLLSTAKSGLSAVVNSADIGESTGNYKDYTGHSVIRVTPKHEEHVDIINSLKDSHPEEIEFWKKPSIVKRSIEIQLSPNIADRVIAHLQTSGIDYSHLTQNVQRLIDEQRAGRSMGHENFRHLNLSTYHPYQEIIEYIDNVARVCGHRCMAYNIGNSYEGRELKVLQIGSERDGKPGIWIDAGLHAREWIAPATALYLISKLIEPTDSFSRYLVNHYTWYILPLANPDGYQYTWTADRLWRKTRSDNPFSRVGCKGADPNRNWDFHWGESGTSSNPCREDYRGISPFSEPETRAMSHYLWSIRDRLSIYLSLHSYGQYWLTPWGYTHSVPDDYEEMMDLGNLAAASVRRHFGTNYTVGSSSRLLYLAPGGSDDWAKGVAGIKYAYTVELKDKGDFGFLLPPHLIEETGREMFNAIRTLAVGVMRIQRRSAMEDPGQS